MKAAFVYRSYENLGIQYLSAVLKERGVTTKLFYDPSLFRDMLMDRPRLARAFDSSDQVVRGIEDFRPDAVLFSTVTFDYRWAKGLATRIRGRSRAKILFGGMHVTSVPAAVAEDGVADFLVVGEGEGALLDLLDSDWLGRAEGIPNVWTVAENGSTGRPPRPLIQDLDALPFPDKDLYHEASDHFRIGYTIVSGRGCPNRCTYCHNNIEGRMYGALGYTRRRSPENVVQELQWARSRHAADFVRFSDDNFCYERAWLSRFLPLYRERVGLPFWCFLHPSGVDRELVRELKASGCIEVQIGVQTLDEEVRRDVIRRPETRDAVATTIDLLGTEGIRCSADFIVNLPGHDEASLVRAARFFAAHPPSRVNAFWVSYFPELDITRLAIERGLVRPGTIERLAHGEGAGTFFQGGTAFDRHLGGAHLLLLASTTLGPRAVGWMTSVARMRRIPFLGFLPTYAIAFVVSYLTRAPKNDLYLRRMRRRYWKFMLRKILHGGLA